MLAGLIVWPDGELVRRLKIKCFLTAEDQNSFCFRKGALAYKLQFLDAGIGRLLEIRAISTKTTASLMNCSCTLLALNYNLFISITLNSLNLFM